MRRRKSLSACLVLLLPATLGQGGASCSPEVSSYIQCRWTVPQGEPDYLSLRRLKLTLEGDADKSSRYFVQMFYKDNNRSASDGQLFVQEAWMRWQVGRGRVTVGQFKPPFGLERFTADWDLDTIDRSLVTDALIPDGKLNQGRSFARDRGVQFDSQTPDGRLWWAFGLFEGHGANTKLRSPAPLLATRLIWTAAQNRTLTAKLGAAFSTRDERDMDFSRALPGSAPLGYAHFAGRDTRIGLEAALDWGRTRFRAEYLRAHFSPDTPSQPHLRASGYYGQLSYAASPRLEAVLKHEGFDPNEAVIDRCDVRQTTLGLTYLLRGRRDRIQLNYVHKREPVAPRDNDALLLQVQKFF